MWETMKIEEVRKKLKTNIYSGLSDKEVSERLIQYGKNMLVDKKKEKLLVRFLKQFQDFMILILIAASVISAVMAYIEGTHDYIDSIIIIFIVVFNAVMGLIQESKAEKALEALKKMSAPTANVKRNGKIINISGEDIVPGDIILLEAGGYVPADCRLISSRELKVEESTLTGETVPVLKDAKVILKENTQIGDMVNMVFGSTNVVSGHAEAIVTDTGMNTKVGKIANMILNNEAPQTPIQKKLEQVGKTLGIVCLVICAAIFVIGIIKKIPIQEMFMTSIGLAVAAIPEGLPAIVTIVLSIGVSKMAKKNAIIRKLPAVETLGSSSVICSDKTGTLTQNKMKIVELANSEGVIVSKKEKEFVLELATMCTDSRISYENKNIVISGDPTETAIVREALNNGKNKNELYERMNRIHDIPFDSGRKLMTTVHRMQDGFRIITKGAPDVLLRKCTSYWKNDKSYILSDILKRQIEKQNNIMADKALRVIGVSYLDIKKLPNKITTEMVEDNLTFVGLIGMIDPPREGVKEAISTCRKAGIKTVMITGDHIATAKAIAKDLGILRGREKAITGGELDAIPELTLQKEIMNYSVFARVSPEHKVKIVNAFQSTGAVVAMTGDGVNDAPALKKADIGVAMGENGTDVAKNASDMILTDDNFITIVEAVKQGRSIFDNIKKAIHFLIATNVGEIVTIFVGLLLGLKSPLLAIQLLWVNLVTDSLPAIALGLEPEDEDIMNRKPREPRKGVFADGLSVKILIEGIMIGMLTLLAFCIGNSLYTLEVGRTMAFLVLGLSELVHAFNIKSEESILKIGILKNKYLLGAFVLGVLLQVSVVCIPQVANIFKLVPLSKVQWIYTVAISSLPLVIIELQKKLNEMRFGKVIYSYKEKRV